MGETTMMGESVNGAFESREHVEVGCFGRECHGRCGEGGFAIESCSRQNSTG
jgi:hypothetical protein